VLLNGNTGLLTRLLQTAFPKRYSNARSYGEFNATSQQSDNHIKRLFMISRQVFPGVLIIALSFWITLFFQSAATSATYDSGATDDGMEVLTRGPIHEAFADVSVNEVPPGIVASRSVPDPINEVPPDYRPEGDNVQWIPGYWIWDDDQNNFIWLSGIWRDIPPGRQWNPGYWVTVAGGSQFVSGYWTETHQAGTIYLPPPPEPVQDIPGSMAMSSDNIWIDGHWIWSNNGYLWQAGYWQRQRPEMVWIPAYYVWTPRGYVFIRGYWDYQLVRRGVLFAPRHYSRPIYSNHNYYYTPSIVLDIDSIFLSLFIRRNHHHYYFGDYHDARYESRGFRPWYSKHATRYGYDPYYRSYRWERMRNDKKWEHNYQQQFQYRRDHRDARPQVVYRFRENHDAGKMRGVKNQMLGKPLAEVIKNNDQNRRFTRLNPEQKRVTQEHSRKLTHSQTERKTVEMVPDNKGKAWKSNESKKPEQLNKFTSPRINNTEKINSPQMQKGNVTDTQHVRPQQRTFSKPTQTEEVKKDQPGFQRLGRERKELNNKQEIQSQVNQTQKAPQKIVEHPNSQFQKNQERKQSLQMKVEEKNQLNPNPQATPQKNRPAQWKDQNAEQPQVKQNKKWPVNPENPTEEQGVLIDDQKVKKPWGQREN
jgi:hypothetical protein